MSLLPSFWQTECIALGRAKNICNKKFCQESSIIPLYRIQNKNKATMWRCYCINDKKLFISNAASIVAGRIKSCGCLHNKLASQRMLQINKNKKDIPSFKREDLSGQKFGQLIAINFAYSKNKTTYWNFECSCGKRIVARVHDVKTKGSPSQCPECREKNKIKSKGENKIASILNKYNIPFERQKSFDSCRFQDTKYLARFDFFVYGKYLIQYDGSTHYKAIGGWNNTEALEKVRKHDYYKTQWCKKNNIPLIRIPYTHYEDLNIKDLLLDTSQYIV